MGYVSLSIWALTPVAAEWVYKWLNMQLDGVLIALDDLNSVLNGFAYTRLLEENLNRLIGFVENISREEWKHWLIYHFTIPKTSIDNIQWKQYVFYLPFACRFFLESISLSTSEAFIFFFNDQTSFSKEATQCTIDIISYCRWGHLGSIFLDYSHGYIHLYTINGYDITTNLRIA